MKPASLVKIVAFIAVMFSPLAALGIAGVALPYGQKPFAAFPGALRVFEGKKGTLDQFGEAVLERSPIMVTAIRAKNYIAYHGVNFVDTDAIIFGRGKWLFHKDELRCVSQAKLAAALDQMDAMIETAKAGGIELIISISPDKGSIYPEELHPLAGFYSSCKRQNNRLWRDLLAQHPGIIDHAVALLAERQRDPGANFYYPTDTHWTPLGSVWALRQLIGAISHTDYTKLPPPVRAGVKARPTDMGAMLLLPGVEEYDQIDSAVENKLSRLAAVPERRTVILYDSFYSAFKQWLPPNFPGAKIFWLDADVKEYPAALASADRVIVNSVERTILPRVDGGILSWGSPFGQAILARAKDKGRPTSQ